MLDQLLSLRHELGVELAQIIGRGLLGLQKQKKVESLVVDSKIAECEAMGGDLIWTCHPWRSKKNAETELLEWQIAASQQALVGPVLENEKLIPVVVEERG
ncbi:hypothetical protein WOC76_08915 [Methylocystis sp. IM3]|uniref:hypothetical protein n=1 Tax=Methylocystis sp. IM3 TaxID=3136722 RepID=UPI0030F5D309